MPARSRRQAQSAEPAARYEFRVWGADLASLFTGLQKSGHLEEIDDSAESYIVSSLPADFNAKIRGGALDVKRFVKLHRRLELWRPYLNPRFPLSRRTVQERICPILSLRPQSVYRAVYDLDPFIEEMIDPCPHLTLVPVQKKRFRFSITGCLAEFTEVSVDTEHLETVAVESEDIATTLRAVARLGIRGQTNRNYQTALKAILNIEGAVSGRPFA